MRKITFLIFFIFTFLNNFGASAADDKERIFSLVWDNDTFSGSDGEYTNGIRLMYSDAEKNMPKFIREAADYFTLFNEEKKRVNFAFGQSMFTPKDKKRSDLVTDDRPYAGWLYASFGISVFKEKTLDNFMLTLGVVGPSSHAEQTQQYVHRITANPKPQGWDHQLKDELGVILTYERKWRGILEASPFGAGFDVIPHGGVNLGNVNTGAVTGATFRLGFDLPADYGLPNSNLSGSDYFLSSSQLNGYLFVTAEERLVVRNIFLDGNTFKESHHVQKRNFVNDIQLGAAATYHDLRFYLAYVMVSKEFKGQSSGSRFGTLSVAWRF